MTPRKLLRTTINALLPNPAGAYTAVRRWSDSGAKRSALKLIARRAWWAGDWTTCRTAGGQILAIAPDDEVLSLSLKALLRDPLARDVEFTRFVSSNLEQIANSGAHASLLATDIVRLPPDLSARLIEGLAGAENAKVADTLWRRLLDHSAAHAAEVLLHASGDLTRRAMALVGLVRLFPARSSPDTALAWRVFATEALAGDILSDVWRADWTQPSPLSKSSNLGRLDVAMSTAPETAWATLVEHKRTLVRAILADVESIGVATIDLAFLATRQIKAPLARAVTLLSPQDHRLSLAFALTGASSWLGGDAADRTIIVVRTAQRPSASVRAVWRALDTVATADLFDLEQLARLAPAADDASAILQTFQTFAPTAFSLMATQHRSRSASLRRLRQKNAALADAIGKALGHVSASHWDRDVATQATKDDTPPSDAVTIARQFSGKRSPKDALDLFESVCTARLKALYKQQDFDACYQLSRELLSAGQTLGDRYWYAILSAGKHHNFDEGRALATEALQKLGDDPESTIWKTRCATASGDFARAIDVFKEALPLHAASAVLWEGLANYFWMRGDVEGALVAGDHAETLRTPGRDFARSMKRWAKFAEAVRITRQPEPRNIQYWAAERLSAPPTPASGLLFARILETCDRDGADPSQHPALTPVRRIGVIGMHLGFGGAPQKAVRLAQALTAEQHGLDKVFLLCPSVGKGPAAVSVEDLQRAGVDAQFYDSGEADTHAFSEEVSRLVSVIEPARRRSRILALARILKQESIDTVHAIGTNEIQLEAGLAGALAGVSRIVLNPGMMRPTRYARKDGALDEAKVYASFLRAASNSTAITLTNNSLVASLDYSDWLDLRATQISVLRNGIDLPVTLKPRAAARKEVGLSGRRPIVLVVGRIAHEKRPDVCLDVIHLLNKPDAPRPKFVFLGEGPLAPWLRKEAQRRGLEDCIQIEGFVSSPSTWYRAADLCLLISEAEGLPNVVIEAQAHGLPVVATDAGGAREGFRHNATGLLVRELRADAIAAAVSELLLDASSRKDAGHAARQFSQEYYAMRRMADAATRLYRGGRRAAVDIFREEAEAFAEGADWAAILAAVPAEARALSETGDGIAARRLVRWALRRDNASSLWESLARLEMLAGRIRSSKARYRTLIEAAARRSNWSIDTLAAVLRAFDLAPFADAPAQSPEEAARLIDEARWSRLRNYLATSPHQLAGQLPATAKMLDALDQLGLKLDDGAAPLSVLLDKIRHDGGIGAPAGHSGVAIWIGTLALGGGERQVSLMADGLAATTGGGVSLVLDHHVPLDQAYESHIPILTVDSWPKPDETDLPADLLDIIHALEIAAGGRPAKNLGRAAALLKNLAPSTLHIRGVAENAIVMAIAGLVAGIPNIIINIGTLLHVRQSSGSHATGQYLARNANLLRRLAALPSVRMVFNSQAALEDWSTEIGRSDRHVVVHNGFRSEDLEGSLSPGIAVQLEHIQRRRRQGQRIVLGVFRFHPVKRPLLWMKAALQAAAISPDLHFVIVGGGKLAAECVQLIGAEGMTERFTFMGRVTNGLADIYRSSDILLHTASTESASNVIIEAQAFRCAIIGPNVGGVGEIVSADTARLFESSNSRVIAEILLGVVADSAWRRQAAQAGPRLVEKRFSYDRMIEQFANLY